MSAQIFARQMRELIEEIRSQGTAAIYCDNLITYLQSVENSPVDEPTQVDLELYRSNLQHDIETRRSQHESSLEMFRSVITSGQNAIRSSFLLNGGAAVALLAFIGHLAQHNASKVILFANCLMYFCYGVLAIVITSGLTYLSQWLYASENNNAVKFGFVFNIACILLGLSSYFLFTKGIFEAYEAFKVLSENGMQIIPSTRR